MMVKADTYAPNPHRPLIIPVENQVRELDPKLLLACIAARQGFTSIIGSHREIDLRIASLPKSIYLCKSFTNRNLRMFEILHRLGHQIVSWDEEALVHLPNDTYYSRRLCPITIRYLSQLFAWGEDNVRLWKAYDAFPESLPIHVTGNPRSDLLRPEIRTYYAEAARLLQEKHGNFILINTNFNHVNAYFPAQNLFQQGKKEGERDKFGKAAVGMSYDYADRLRNHKNNLFTAFQKLIPEIDAALPQLKIVVRPHPTESQKIYKEIAKTCRNVTVTNEGNIVPWLMATKAVVHNGCTTGIEAYMLNVPALSYRPVIDDRIDMGFYRLPNLVSHACYDDRALVEALAAVAAGHYQAKQDEQSNALILTYLAAQTGPLACERIIDALAHLTFPASHLPGRGLFSKTLGWMHANARRLIKRTKAYLPGTHAPPEFHRHRYPDVTLEELQNRIERFKAILGEDLPIKISHLFDQIYLIRAETRSSDG